jgi:hypothetical protein
MRSFFGVVAGFPERTPYPSGKRSDGGAVRKVCRGCCWALGNAFPSKDGAEEFCFSFQTPIRASEFMKRSEKLRYSSARRETWTRFNLEQRAPDGEGSARRTNTRHVPKVGYANFLNRLVPLLKSEDGGCAACGMKSPEVDGELTSHGDNGFLAMRPGSLGSLC